MPIWFLAQVNMDEPVNVRQMHFLLTLEINQFFIIDQNHYIFLNRGSLISAELHFGRNDTGQSYSLAKLSLRPKCLWPKGQSGQSVILAKV